jgi:carbonic anhydrase
MKKLSSLLVSASLVCTLQGYAADTYWGYTGADSPEKWGELDAKYATSKTGKYQSPINITTVVPTAVIRYRSTPMLRASYKFMAKSLSSSNFTSTAQASTP